MKATLTLLLIFTCTVFSSLKAQTDIKLIPDYGFLYENTGIFTIKSTPGNKIVVTYIGIPKGCVKSDDESEMNGKAIAVSGSAIKGVVDLSDIAVTLTIQEVDPLTSTTKILNTHIIAVRNVSPTKTYKFVFNGSLPRISSGVTVPFNKSNLNSIPNLSADEIQILMTYIQNLSQKNNNAKPQEVTNEEVKEEFKALGQLFKSRKSNYDVTLETGAIDEKTNYFFTKDKRVEKEEGIALKTYLQFNEKEVVGIDSFLLKEKIDVLKPVKVFDINKNYYNGMLMRIACKPLLAQKKDKIEYFRYFYFDKETEMKRYKFQLENPTTSSLKPYMAFKLDSGIIYLARNKSDGYESYLLSADTIQLKYPGTDKDTFQIKNLFCGTNRGTLSHFGQERKFFLNSKIGDYVFLGEQESEYKFSAGLTKMDAPDAQEQGYSISRLYCIHNKSVKGIYNIRVPNFSQNVSETTLISQNERRAIHLVSMAFPVLYILKSSGDVDLVSGDFSGFTPLRTIFGKSYTVNANNIEYIICSKKETGEIKLVKLNY